MSVTGRLILVRHGESEANRAGVMDSCAPGLGLSELGRRQATELATRLSGRAVGRLISSTARRALETAAPVAAALGLKVEPEGDLVEIDCGELSGRGDQGARTCYEDTYAIWISGDGDHPIPGGESWNQIERRMLRAFSRLGEPSWPGAVVMVGHGGSMRIALATLVGPEAAQAVGYLPNAGIMQLSPKANGVWELESYDAGQANAFDAISPHRGIE